MPSSDLVARPSCPLCGSGERVPLFAVHPDIFVGNNPTIDRQQLRLSGLLDLPHIELMECGDCHLRYCGHMLSPHWSRVFWESVYKPELSQAKILKRFKRLSNIRIWSTLAQIALATDIADGQFINVLDVGCGWGDFLLTARAPGIRTVGIEISPPKIEFARSQGIEVYGSLEELPADLRFHIFHCDQVLEHVDHPARLLEQIEPRLEPSFVGYVGVPDYADQAINDLSAAIQTGQAVHDKDLITWDHLNFFSSTTFQQLLAQRDFVPVVLPDGLQAGQLTSTAGYIRRATAVAPNVNMACTTCAAAISLAPATVANSSRLSPAASPSSTATLLSRRLSKWFTRTHIARGAQP